jgi:hypothetical protein
MPAHEQFALDVESDLSCRNKLAEMIRDKTLPPCYFEHKVVTDNPGEHVVPVALYLDAVPFSQTDSVLGWWLVNLVSGQRYLYGVLRKSMACKCGCRGYCSFHMFFSFTLWSLRCLALGRYPSERHDNREWRPSDSGRVPLSGKPILFKAACIYIKGDWSEYASTLGFPNWADGLRPCFECSGYGPDLFVAAHNTMEDLRWRLNEPLEYHEACNNCSIIVDVSSEADRAEIVRHLRYDKRVGGCHGRTLNAPIQRLGLQTDDRLEPSSQLPDVGFIEQVSLPCTVKFWRCAQESLTRHPNIIFDASIGILPTTVLTIDSLHALYLGVMKIWARIAIWLVLDSGIFGDIGTASENLQIACLALRSSLMTFYKRRHSEDPAEQLTRLSDLTPKMVGTRASPHLKTKGAETFGMLRFLMYVLDLYKDRLGEHWQRVLQAGQALDRIWRESPWRLSVDAQNDIEK